MMSSMMQTDMNTRHTLECEQNKKKQQQIIHIKHTNNTHTRAYIFN